MENAHPFQFFKFIRFHHDIILLFQMCLLFDKKEFRKQRNTLVVVKAQTTFENSQPIPIPPLHCVQVVQRSDVAGEVGSEFWRPARFVERIYVYLILWRLTVGTGDRTGLRDSRRYSLTMNALFFRRISLYTNSWPRMIIEPSLFIRLKYLIRHQSLHIHINAHSILINTVLTLVYRIEKFKLYFHEKQCCVQYYIALF